MAKLIAPDASADISLSDSLVTWFYDFGRENPQTALPFVMAEHLTERGITLDVPEDATVSEGIVGAAEFSARAAGSFIGTGLRAGSDLISAGIDEALNESNAGKSDGGPGVGLLALLIAVPVVLFFFT